MNLRKIFQRWRHYKGYGVHSPFAYRFVTNVLRPGRYSFYSYEEIDNFLTPAERKDYRHINFIKFIIRLANFLKTRRIVSFGKINKGASAAALALRLPAIDISEKEFFSFETGDLLIAGEDFYDISLLRNAVSCGVAIFAIRPSFEIREFLETPLDRGILFNDKDRIILIPREETAYVAYDIKLPINNEIP